MPLRPSFESHGFDWIPDYSIALRSAPRPPAANRPRQADECGCRQCTETRWGPVPDQPPMRPDHQMRVIDALDALADVD
jgi:hypothetical protein